MATDGGGAAEVAGSVMPLLLCTFMIVSMQLGFAMLEVGCVRQEHRMTVLAKNLLDTMVSSLSFSLGCEIFQPSIVKQDGVVENHLIFLHWAFLSTAVTICSGSMAERAHLAAYLCYAVLMSGLAYPVLADSVWGDGTGAGFLYHQFHPSGGHRYYDYAGAGVIHLAGAMAALAGNSLLGRRILRPPAKELSHTQGPQGQGDDTAQLKEAIQEEWQRRFDRAEDDEKEFRPNSYLQVMGVLNLWVGCYGFNASPAFARRDPHRVEIATLSAWNTTLAAGAGACGTFLHSCIFHKNMQLGFLCNGLLSGLVCLTVACDILTPAATVLLGFLCGFLVYPAGSYALKKMRIDDPADAIPVHGGSAIFGILSVAFCTPSCDTESGSAYGHHFCADHHTIGGQLLVQLLGVGTILVWISCVIFPVWALFLVSECVYTSELEQLSETYEHACHVDLEAAKSMEEDFWTSAARHSRITRHLLRQHGWNLIGSPFKDAAAASDFRQDMVEAIHSSKTALEFSGVAVRLLQGIARQFARFRCFRELARIRLRIAPFAELSGLGAMAGTGKEVAEIVREVLEIVTDSHGEERKDGLPLQLQVEQLRRQVQNQGVLLQRLSRNKRYAGYRSLAALAPRLASVTETTEVSEVSEVSAPAELARAAMERSNSPKAPSGTDAPRREQNIPMLPIGSTGGRGRPPQREETGHLAQLHSATHRSLTPEERPLRREVTNRSLQSASTVSDKSVGLITPRSEGDETPPPTTYGCSYGYRQRSTVSSGQPEAALQVMATQLASLLQAQQRLASSLPDLRNEEFHRQLIAALERRESSGSERSSRFEVTPRPETGGWQYPPRLAFLSGTAPSNV